MTKQATFARCMQWLGIAMAALIMPGTAMAEIKVGVILSTTGSTAALGIPMKNTLAFFPDQIGGEKLNLIVVDDASDPATATTLARRLITEDKVDIILGSPVTGPSIAIAGVAFENDVPQLALSPVNLPEGRDAWTFRLPQQVKLMASAVVDHMKTNNIKTVGIVGFSDAWGDFWLRDLKALSEPAGIRIVADERYARADTTVTGQVLKVLSAKPDAVLVAASGTAAALPQITLRERGYKGPIYQTHGAATQDLIRIGGAAVEGVILPAGPAIVAEQLPESSQVKPASLAFVTQYEARYGAGSRNQFGAHIFDALQLLNRVVPVALKSAQPGTKAFRSAIRTALESEKDIVGSQGVFNFTKDDHFGLDQRGRVLITVKDGRWSVLP